MGRIQSQNVVSVHFMEDANVFRVTAAWCVECRHCVVSRGVARILVWGGINFRNLVSMAVISLSRHDIHPVLCVRKKDLISNGDYFLHQQS